MEVICQLHNLAPLPLDKLVVPQNVSGRFGKEKPLLPLIGV